MNVDPVPRTSYHHGDLRDALLQAAKSLIAEAGIDNLSLRKLAERAGVSRTAPYHHFSDKNDLLCAIAAQGFQRRHAEAVANFEDTLLTPREKFEQYILDYVKFAANNPEQYELMFGRNIWKQQKSTQELRDVAYPCFQHQVEMVSQLAKLWTARRRQPSENLTGHLGCCAWHCQVIYRWNLYRCRSDRGSVSASN